MKFSPIMIFVFILVVLAISIIFGDVLKDLVSPISSKAQQLEEGFLSYNYDAQSSFKKDVIIKFYSPTRKVDRLYDNIYYDYSTGTVLVLSGPQNDGIEKLLSDLSGAQAVYQTKLQIKTAKDTELATATTAETAAKTAADAAPTDTSKATAATAATAAKNAAKTAADAAKTDLDTAFNAYMLADKAYRKGTPKHGYTLLRRDTTYTEHRTVDSPETVYEDSDSKLTDLKSSYMNMTIDIDTYNDKYVLAYMPWGKETYIHIIQLVKDKTPISQHLRTYAYDASGQRMQSNGVDTGVSYSGALIEQKYSTTKSTQNNNTYALITEYSKTQHLLQLCVNLSYNYINGDLVSKVDNQLFIYPRPSKDNTGSGITPSKKEITQGFTNTITNVMPVVPGFSAGVMDTYDKNYTILYIAVGRRTILVSFECTDERPEVKMFKIRNVVLFGDDNKRVVRSNQIPTPENTLQYSPPSGENRDINAYYQFLLGMMGTSDGNISKLPITNDYMLKTQIVPPVCPTCPSCPAAQPGVCTNCGGQGGSGTQTGSTDKKTDNDGKEVVDLLKSTGSGATSLVRDAGSGATSLARDTASGTVGLAKETVGGTVGLAKETVGGAVGLAKETVGGAVGLAKEAGSGIANTFGKLNPTVVSSPGSEGTTPGVQGQQPTQGQSAGTGAGVNITAGADPTSYFGALPAKGGDFIPVTADFSRFGR